MELKWGHALKEAAGTAIPEGPGNRVQVDLPAGSRTNRTLHLQARNFTGIVPSTVIGIPENRHATPQIDMSGGNPSFVTVNVGIPDDTISRIQTSTR